MNRLLPAALIVSLSFGSVVSAQQPGYAAIRASIDLEGARLASSLAESDHTRDQSKAAGAATDEITKDRMDERVRITTSDGRKTVGWIDRIDEHTLRLTRARGPAMTVPRNAIARIERPNGKRSRGRSAGLGYLIGAVLPPFGAIAGAVVGALLPNQKWTTVPLSSLAP